MLFDAPVMSAIPAWVVAFQRKLWRSLNRVRLSSLHVVARRRSSAARVRSLFTQSSGMVSHSTGHFDLAYALLRFSKSATRYNTTATMYNDHAALPPTCTSTTPLVMPA